MNNINEHKKLLQYLEGKLSSEEAHAFEQEMADSELLNDAVEGLQQVQDTTQINQYIVDLNKQLKEYTSSKKKRRVNYKMQFNFWALISIALILILIVVAYLVITKFPF
ncbi:MAG: hypothetical protein KGZ59_11770 [Chitinophagaceae bacterium]|nr:hypothetical protein [Chitinophagaceae bacterium]